MGLSNKYKILLFILVLGILSAVFHFLFRGNTVTKVTVNSQVSVSVKKPEQIKIIATKTQVVSTSSAATTSAEKIPVGTDNFTVSLNASSTNQVASDLLSQGFIQNTDDFVSAFNLPNVSPGAYMLSKDFSVSDTIKVLKSKPYMKWVVIPPGLRKEEIAGLLQTTLGWTSSQRKNLSQ